MFTYNYGVHVLRPRIMGMKLRVFPLPGSMNEARIDNTGTPKFPTKQ